LELKILTTRDIRQAIESGYDLIFQILNHQRDVSIDTFGLIIEGLWEKIQDGLT
jgi:nucleoid DNA-binding protein